MGIENGKSFTAYDARIVEMAELALKGTEVTWVVDALPHQKIIAYPQFGVYRVDNEGKPIEQIEPPTPKVDQKNRTPLQPNLPFSKTPEPVLNDPETVKQFAQRVGKARGIYK